MRYPISGALHRPSVTGAAHRFRVLPVALVLVTLVVPAHSRADVAEARESRQSLASIEGAARDFLDSLHDASAAPEVEVRPLDSRLRLARCTEPLDARFSTGAAELGRTTVEVACRGTPGWRVQVRANVTVAATIWVLVRAVRRGERLERGLLREEHVRLGSSGGAALRIAARRGAGGFDAASGREPVRDPTPWIGREFVRSVGAGRPLVGDALATPTLVARGRTVRLRHRSAGLEIEAIGTALTDGRLGERVRVRNTGTGQSVDGIVDGTDEVRIP